MGAAAGVASETVELELDSLGELGFGGAGAETGSVATGETPGGAGAAGASRATIGVPTGAGAGGPAPELDTMDCIGRGRVATGETPGGAAAKFSLRSELCVAEVAGISESVWEGAAEENSREDEVGAILGTELELATFEDMGAGAPRAA
jgi:hypothetical protein